MAAITVTELVATLGAQVKRGEWAHVESFLRGAVGGLTELFGRLEGVGVAAIEAIRETALEGDEFSGLSAQLGVATQALQELQYAATLSDASAEGLTQGLTYLARTAAEAAAGGQDAAEALAGIELRGADGEIRAADELLGDLADKMAKMPSATARLALGLKVLGRGSRELVPFLAQGRAGIERLRQEARLSGVVLTREAVAAGEAYDDAAKRLQASLTGLRHVFASPEAVDALTEIQVALGRLARAGAVREALAALGKVTASVLKLVGALVSSFTAWLDRHPEVGVSLLVTAAEALGVALGYLAVTTLPLLWGALAPVLPLLLGIGAAFGALYLIADDLRAFSEGADSVLGRVIKWLSAPIDPSKDGILGTFKALYRAGQDLFGVLARVDWAPALEAALKLVRLQLDGLRLAMDLLATSIRTLQSLGVNVQQAAAAGLEGIGRAALPGGNLVGAALDAQRLYRTVNAPITSTVNVTVEGGGQPGPVAEAVESTLNQWWSDKVAEEFVSLGVTP